MSRNRSPRLVALCAALAACAGPDPAESPAYMIRDSAGITIVETAPVRAREVSAWELVQDPVVRIGSHAGEPWEMLHGVQDARTLRDGRIAVVDNGSAQLFLYTAGGEYLATLGGRGDGPGEFRSPWRVVQLPGDSLLILDYQAPMRFSVFTPEGHFHRSFASIHPADTRRLSNVEGQFGDGSLLASAIIDTGPTVTIRVHDLDVLLGRNRLYRIAPAGVIAGELGDFGVSAQALASGNLAFPPRGYVAASDDAFHHGIGHSTFEIRSYDSQGELRRILRHAAPPRPVTADMMAENEAASEQSLAQQPPGAQAVLRARLGTFHYPPVLPLHTDIIATRAGALWVKRYPYPRDAPQQWDVFDEEGRYQGVVDLPERFSLREVGAEHVLGIWLDEFDVEYVVRFALRRPATR